MSTQLENELGLSRHNDPGTTGKKWNSGQYVKRSYPVTSAIIFALYAVAFLIGIVGIFACFGAANDNDPEYIALIIPLAAFLILSCVASAEGIKIVHDTEKNTRDTRNYLKKLVDLLDKEEQ